MKNPTLSIDLIREILLRLPVRYLLRLKCICKAWLSLISDPQFGISHYDRDVAPFYRLILASNNAFVKCVDVNAPLNKCDDAVHLLLPPPSPASNPGGCQHFYDFPFEPYTLGSCRGFILLNYARTDEIIIWNPSLGIHKLLPDFELYGITKFLFGFGYDPSTHDYLLIVIQLSEQHGDESKILIFSFKTYSWDVEYIPVEYMDLGHTFRAGTLVNEALHWLVLRENYKNVHVIIAFDLIKRRLSEISLSDHLDLKNCGVYGLREMGGCLCVCFSNLECDTTEIWVMKKYKVESSWTKSIVITTNDVPYYQLDSLVFGNFSPICITKDGGIVGSNVTGTLEKLNDKGELLEEVKYGEFEGLDCINLQSVMYRESLLPLPGVIEETSENDQQ